jgi:hypothetical protein
LPLRRCKCGATKDKKAETSQSHVLANVIFGHVIPERGAMTQINTAQL